jgi:hypothetical protein
MAETMELLKNVAYLGIYQDELGALGIELNFDEEFISPEVKGLAMSLYGMLSTEEGRSLIFNFDEKEADI